jgi:caffeoyl-CoA O-methyltransferase
MNDRLEIWDKLLPSQTQNNEFYGGHADDYHRRLFETIVQSSGIPNPVERFRLAQSDRFTLAEMASNPVSLRMLELLISLSGARRVLEIGCFIGLSAMTMAAALPDDGHLTTIEKFDEFAAIAERNFQNNGFSGKISLLRGDAFDLLPELPAGTRFDIAFIDGNKERYADYVRLVEPLMAPGGLILVDDSLFHGDVLNDAPKTEKGAGVQACLQLAASMQDYERLLLPLGNGLMILRKRRS